MANTNVKDTKTPIMIIVVFCAIGLLFMLQLANFAWPGSGEPRLRPGDIRNSEVIYNNTPYTLGFDQHNALIKHINTAVVMQNLPAAPATVPGGVEAITIYPFGAKKIVLTPIHLNDGSTLFSAPALQPTGYLVDISGVELTKLLDSAHD